MTLSPHPHDAFFKQLFTRPEVAEDFVRHYLPEEVVAVLEPGSLTITKDSFIDEALRRASLGSALSGTIEDGESGLYVSALRAQERAWPG